MKKTNYIGLAVILLLFGLADISKATVVAVVDGSGQLMGINEIDISGETWNVAFKEGSFDVIFNAPSDDFDFTDMESANLASKALLDAFNLYIPLRYTLNPNLTYGIENRSLIQIDAGNILTPYMIDDESLPVRRVVYSAFQNFNSIINDRVFKNIKLAAADTINDTPFVYADWTKVSSVPVPAAFWLMGSGLLGVLGFSRKRAVGSA